MFFMMGIMPGRKDLTYNPLIICSRCGRYGRYMIYVTYNVLSLFFIPVFKWGRQYYAETSCCGTVYRLDPEIGRSIEHGEQPEIRPEDLTYISGGYNNQNSSRSGYNDPRYSGNGYRNPNSSGRGYANDGSAQNAGPRMRTRRCANCGYTTEEDFEYCPKCGRRFH